MVPPRAARRCEIVERQSPRRARFDCAGLDAQAERERAENRELRARVDAVEIGRRIRFGVAARAALRRAPRPASSRRFHPRQHRVASCRSGSRRWRHAVAGEPVADRAHDRHRAADRRFEPQLPPLPLGERQQRGPVLRHRLLVRGDDRFAAAQRRADLIDRRLDAAESASTMMSTSLASRIVEAVGPVSGGRAGRGVRLKRRASRAARRSQMCVRRGSGRGIGAASRRATRRSDRAEAEEPIRQRRATSSGSPDRLHPAGGPGAGFGTWTRARARRLPWRRRACPSATLDEEVQYSSSRHRPDYVYLYIHIR